MPSGLEIDSRGLSSLEAQWRRFRGTAAVEMHQIRYFLAVCETLNFTRAAESCNVSQPSLTRAIQGLGGDVDPPLLVQGSPHRLVTTGPADYWSVGWPRLHGGGDSRRWYIEGGAGSHPGPALR